MSEPHHWRERTAHAHERLDEVEAILEGFLASDPYETVQEFNSDGVFRFRVKKTQQIPRKVSLLLMDAFGATRSSLDHLMYALASDASGEAPSGTEFPVFFDRAKFKRRDKKGSPSAGSGLFKMRGAPARAQALVQRLQPYRRGSGYVDDPLWILHDFAVVDKHRKPHLTGAVAEGATLGINGFRDVDLHIAHWGARLGPFDSQAVIGECRFTQTGPNPYVQMHGEITFGVSLDPKGPGRGRPVTYVRELVTYVEEAVFPLLEPYLPV